MRKINFPLNDWAKKEPAAAVKSSAVVNHVVAATRAALPATDLFSQVRAVVEEVERQHIDLTCGYIPWRNIGFALAEGMGNQGRDYFHRISALNADYDYTQCDKQYDACLNAHGSGITINSLFHAAKEAGIDIGAIARQFSTSQTITQIPQFEDSAEKLAETCFPRPTFSDKLPKEDFPGLMQRVFGKGKLAEYLDMILFAFLVIISAIVPKVIGRYRRRYYHSNLYGFITAPAASDKGDLPIMINLVKPVQDVIRAASNKAMAEYEERMAEYQTRKQQRGINPGVEPKKPVYKTLFVDGNSSATAMYQTLSENQETGSLLFETEADVISQSCRNKEWGDFSTGLRMAFQHEAIRYRRRAEDERVDIPHPQLSVLISGTPDQVGTMIPSAQDGSFSRYAFMEISRKLIWEDVFEEEEMPMEEMYESIGKEYYEKVYLPLSKREKPLVFCLKVEQRKPFNAFFDELQKEQSSMLGDEIVATVRRLGLIAFRLMMVLSVIRLADAEDIDLTTLETLECDDRDFRIAMEMVNVLISHATSVYTNLLNHPQKHYTAPAEGMNLAEKTIMEKLNKRFTRPEYLKAAAECGVCEKTADRYLGKLQNRYKLAIRVQNGIFEMLK